MALWGPKKKAPLPDNGYVPPAFEMTDDLSGEQKIREIIKRELPDFVRGVKDKRTDVMTVHQDAFASGYDAKELILLGMAVKYAGFYGKTVMIIGKNGETC